MGEKHPNVYSSISLPSASVHIFLMLSLSFPNPFLILGCLGFLPLTS
jgi:hypothetical protein